MPVQQAGGQAFFGLVDIGGDYAEARLFGQMIGDRVSEKVVVGLLLSGLLLVPDDNADQFSPQPKRGVGSNTVKASTGNASVAMSGERSMGACRVRGVTEERGQECPHRGAVIQPDYFRPRPRGPWDDESCGTRSCRREAGTAFVTPGQRGCVARSLRGCALVEDWRFLAEPEEGLTLFSGRRLDVRPC